MGEERKTRVLPHCTPNELISVSAATNDNGGAIARASVCRAFSVPRQSGTTWPTSTQPLTFETKSSA